MPIQGHLNFNTQHRTSETGANNCTPLVLLSNKADVEVMLCVQPMHRGNLTIAQALTARLWATPTYHYLTAKLRCNQIG